MSIEGLRTLLQSVPSGPLATELSDEVIDLLSDCWDSINGASDTSMAGHKVTSLRVENLAWEPPNLTFAVERHGGAVQGSKSAELQEWSVDLENNTAVPRLAGKRRLERFQQRLDTRALAVQVLDLVQQKSADVRLTWKSATCVKINVAVVIPDGPANQTTQGRRKRFRRDLETLMLATGWRRKSSGTQLVFENALQGRSESKFLECSD